MRFKYASLILGVAALLGASANPQNAQAQYYSFYGGPSYYHPVRVYYYRPYVPMTYVRTADYAPSAYRSYYSPCVCYQPSPCQDSYSSQPSGTSTYSSPRPTLAAPTTTATVGAYDNRFEPSTINVQPGTTVRWINYGKHSHTVTATDGRWDSGDIKPGASYSATFKQAGTYYFYCRHHTQDRMQGTIVVSASGNNAAGASNSTGY
jgi:plastocyanin